MKKLLTIIFLFPFVLSAQQIKKNEYDKALKAVVIETSESVLKEDKDANLMVSLKSLGHSFFLNLKGRGLGASTIQQNDPAIFLLDNDETVTVKSTSVQTYDGDQSKNSYEHEYSISLNNLKLLSQHNLKAVRKYGIKGSIDIRIPEAHQFDLRKTSLLFLSELVSAQVLSNEEASYTYVRDIELGQMSKFIGDSISVCGKVQSTYYLKSSLDKPTLLSIGDTENEMLTVVIYESNRSSFKEAPDKYFLNKEVCVKGRIELYKNKPQIVIRKEQDIAVKDSTSVTKISTN